VRVRVRVCVRVQSFMSTYTDSSETITRVVMSACVRAQRVCACVCLVRRKRPTD
jgi:hypothetical protein